MIKVQVTGNIATVTERPRRITSGTVGLPVEFTFDSQWDGLTKVVMFRAGEVTQTIYEPAEGTVLAALDGSQSFTIGRAVNPDGSYTETVLTTFEGTYVALAKAIRAISDNMVGILKYFNAQ